jgi:hypothetical protein
MIEPLSLGSQADRNIAQTFSIGELCEDHAQKLVPAGKSSCSIIAFVSSHALPELVHGKMVEQLSEDGPSGVHTMPSRLPEHGERVVLNSNRLRPSFAFQPYKIGVCANLPKVNRTPVVPICTNLELGFTRAAAPDDPKDTPEKAAGKAEKATVVAAVPKKLRLDTCPIRMSRSFMRFTFLRKKCIQGSVSNRKVIQIKQGISSVQFTRALLPWISASVDPRSSPSIVRQARGPRLRQHSRAGALVV